MLDRKNWDLLDAAQRQYLPLAEMLRSRQLSQVATIAVSNATKSTPVDVGNVAIMPLGAAVVEVVIDSPRSPGASNRRLYRSGGIQVEASREHPWQVSLSLADDSVTYDLCVGPATMLQQRDTAHGDDGIAACRSGVLRRRYESGRVVFSIGTHIAGNKVLPFDICWVDAKDAKSVLVHGRFEIGDPRASVHCGNVTTGQIVLGFDRPVRHQLAKLDASGQAVLRQNSELASPPTESATLFNRAWWLLDAATKLPLDAATGFGVYEVAYIEEVLEGITGTDWSVRQVAQAAAGMLDSFTAPCPVMFPKDASVVSVSQASRLRAELSDGTVWTLPADIDVRLKPGDYSHLDVVGTWRTASGKPIRAASLVEPDVYAMLSSVVHKTGITGEHDGRDAVYAPVGTLGSLAVRDDKNNVLRFVGCNKQLWDDSIGSYVLPAMLYDTSLQFGSYTFDVLQPICEQRRELKRKAKRSAVASS
jgi:hypothetical protein